MKNIILAIIVLLITVTQSYSWENLYTHPHISQFVAEQYFLSVEMNKPVNGKAAVKWIREGATLEDAGSNLQFLDGTARSLNHFHNPTKSKLDEAGLSDLPFFIPNGESALLWAQDVRVNRNTGTIGHGNRSGDTTLGTCWKLTQLKRMCCIRMS